MELFSKDSYVRLIKLAEGEGFQFRGFQEENLGQRTIYLRHDVDYSLSIAVELARINASLGVRGTFFVLLRSQIYNLLSHWALDQVQEILASGQRVAFHCTLPASIPANHENMARIVFNDFDIVRGQIPKIEPVFSWHNPSREVLAKSLNFELPDFVNVYHHRFLEEAHYLSDSNLRYSIPQWEKLLVVSERSVLHLLFHPLNWVVGGRDMSEVLAGTWRYIIRERELEVGLNQTYKKLYPSGMPNDVLEAFSREWSKLARESQ